ncbi:MAG: amidohydrolase family protein [Acidobacteria bacterium]|nr:amidohydrolase family protein [Acidobacteriota bacterium]MBV9067468.1 amidohydrolase family protein [Acidobacteriota bacterium]MBV9186954.1 amidohydrolase family protein [Acidobacteriota bacterium]
MKRLLFAILLLAAPLFAQQTAITNVRLFDGTKVIPHATVLIDGTRIAAAGATVAVPKDANVIDGNGKTLLPGLIDSHTHVFPGSLERALRFGVTTELDMFTSLRTLDPLRAEQAKGSVTNRADVYSAGTLVTVAGGHGSEYFPIPTFKTGDDPQAFVDARIAEGSDYIKLIVETGEAYGMKLPTLSKSDLTALIAAAHKRGKMAVVHISTLAGARDAIDAGADALVHIFADKVPDAGFGAFVAAHHAFVVPTLTVNESTTGIGSGTSLNTDAHLAPYLNADEMTNLKTSFPKAKDLSLDNAYAAVRQLKAAGVPILAGTDAPNPGTAHGASMHREMELLVRSGLTPLEALTAATSLPAKQFKLNDRGRVAAGLRADLLLVDGDPTTDILATRNIAGVWKNGAMLDRKPEPKRVEAAPVAAVVPNVGDGMINNFDSGDTKPAFGSGWDVSTDSIAGGKSTASMDVVAGGANGTPKSLHIHADTQPGFMFPWAGAMLMLGATPMQPVDLSSKSGLSFFAKGDTEIRVMLFAASTGRIPRQTTVHAGADWTAITLPWIAFNTDGKDVQMLVFCGPDKGTVDFAIDELRLK